MSGLAQNFRRGVRHSATIRWGIVDWMVALGLALCALPITFHQLGAQSLWLDEGTSQAYVTSHHLGQLLVDLINPTQAYPLYHLILKVTTRVLGDGEWALRAPSALAGALAVPALYLLGVELRGRVTGLVAAALLLIAPWGLRQAQDAKAYSLALLTTIMLVLTLTWALRLGTRRAWLAWAVVAVAAPFVHRLLLLSVLGCVVSWAIFQPRARRWPVLIGAAIMAVVLIGGIVGGLRYYRAAGQFGQIDPLAALRLQFAQFAVGQYAHDVPRRWLVPFALLALLGLVRCVVDLRHPVPDAAVRRGTYVLLVMGGLPLGLFLALVATQPAYEARYLVGVFPFWLLLQAWAITSVPIRRGSPERYPMLQVIGVATAALLVVSALIVERSALLQPHRGIFSGAPIKEDYRGAVRTLAEHVHPDDLVIVHPKSILPLYTYYARRVTFQPLPEPVELSSLFQANIKINDLDRRIRPLLLSHKRAWLLIAPDHARVDDPPPTAADDVGYVGLAFQYGDRERRIQCGEQPFAGFVGVRLYCNNLPDIDGKIPEPAEAVESVFGGQLRLRGYTVTPFAGGPQPGGTLPLTLFWEPLVDLSGTDYTVFVHLTLPDNPKPLAQLDGRPMEGGQPTSRWTRPHALLHDDRAMPLPADLPPGRYVLRMGVYRASDGTRLTARTTAPTLDNAVVLGEVQIVGR